MRIDLWSDLICPWCYLGEHRLEQALDQVPWGADVQVRMRAYQLDPRAPREPHDLQDAIDRKYGRGAFEAMSDRITALGRTEGLDYRFDRAKRVNTFDAHRLVAWADAASPPAAVALTRRLFVAYFTDGANIADPAVLTAAATAVGLDVDGARALVTSNDFGTQVEADRAAAVDHEISGVPAFVIEGRWLISGAQDVHTLVRMLERAHQRFVATAPDAPAESWVSDDVC